MPSGFPPRFASDNADFGTRATRAPQDTSDHGYAATGHFPDADGEVGHFLKEVFASGRSAAGVSDTGPFVPPVALQIMATGGPYVLALGRRKWRSPGGYPTLTHGGLSLLEVLSPFVELTK
jgi:hypothetical protein